MRRHTAILPILLLFVHFWVPVESLNYKCHNNQVLVVQSFGNDTIRMHCQRLDLCGYQKLKCDYDELQPQCGGKLNFVAHVNQKGSTAPVEHTCCNLFNPRSHRSIPTHTGNDCFIYELPDGSSNGKKVDPAPADDAPYAVLKNPAEIPEQFDGVTGYRLRLFLLKNKSPPTLLVKGIERRLDGYRVTICRPRCTSYDKVVNENEGTEESEWKAISWSSWSSSSWSTWARHAFNKAAAESGADNRIRTRMPIGEKGSDNNININVESNGNNNNSFGERSSTEKSESSLNKGLDSNGKGNAGASGEAGAGAGAEAGNGGRGNINITIHTNGDGKSGGNAVAVAGVNVTLNGKEGNGNGGTISTSSAAVASSGKENEAGKDKKKDGGSGDDGDDTNADKNKNKSKDKKNGSGESSGENGSKGAGKAKGEWDDGDGEDEDNGEGDNGKKANGNGNGTISVNIHSPDDNDLLEKDENGNGNGEGKGDNAGDGNSGNGDKNKNSGGEGNGSSNGVKNGDSDGKKDGDNNGNGAGTSGVDSEKDNEKGGSGSSKQEGDKDSEESGKGSGKQNGKGSGENNGSGSGDGNGEGKSGKGKENNAGKASRENGSVDNKNKNNSKESGKDSGKNKGNEKPGVGAAGKGSGKGSDKTDGAGSAGKGAKDEKSPLIKKEERQGVGNNGKTDKPAGPTKGPDDDEDGVDVTDVEVKEVGTKTVTVPKLEEILAKLPGENPEPENSLTGSSNALETTELTSGARQNASPDTTSNTQTSGTASGTSSGSTSSGTASGSTSGTSSGSSGTSSVASDAVAADAAGSSGGSSGGRSNCFAADSLVTTVTGQKRMDELQIGDFVLVPSAGSVLKYERVEMFYHREPETRTNFVVIYTKSGKKLSMTGRHLLPVADCEVVREYTRNPDGIESAMRESKYAEKARKGDCVLSVDSETREVVADEIVRIGRMNSQGIYSPMTVEGSLVVDGVLSSCFSHLESHSAHKLIFDFIYYVYHAFGLLNTSHVDLQPIPAFVSFAQYLSKTVLPFS